jgi:hypothetical protein
MTPVEGRVHDLLRGHFDPWKRSQIDGLGIVDRVRDKDLDGADHHVVRTEERDVNDRPGGKSPLNSGVGYGCRDRSVERPVALCTSAHGHRRLASPGPPQGERLGDQLFGRGMKNGLRGADAGGTMRKMPGSYPPARETSGSPQPGQA